MGCPCLTHPPPWLFLGWGMQGVIAEMGTGGPEMAGQVPRALQVPKPCPKPVGLCWWHWAGNGGPCPTAHTPCSQVWRAAQRAAPASPTEPESHAQHEKGEEKVTITTSATTSPRGNDHLTATLHTTAGREDSERSLVRLGDRELLLEHRGGHRHSSSASPERDLLLGFQFPRRLRASALQASVLGSLGLRGEQSSGSGFPHTGVVPQQHQPPARAPAFPLSKPGHSPGGRGAQSEMP